MTVRRSRRLPARHARRRAGPAGRLCRRGGRQRSGRSGRTGRSRRRGRWSGRSAPIASSGTCAWWRRWRPGASALTLRRAAIDEIGRLLGEPPRDRGADRRRAGRGAGRRVGAAAPPPHRGRRRARRADGRGDLRAARAVRRPPPRGDRAPARWATPATFVTRWTPSDAGPSTDLGLLVTELTRQTLEYLDRHPGRHQRRRRACGGRAA